MVMVMLPQSLTQMMLWAPRAVLQRRRRPEENLEQLPDRQVVGWWATLRPGPGKVESAVLVCWSMAVWKDATVLMAPPLPCGLPLAVPWWEGGC